MPAKSQKQRAYLNSKFGHEWVKAHHFDNKGKLPMYAKKKGKAAKSKATSSIRVGPKKMGPWKGCKGGMKKCY